MSLDGLEKFLDSIKSNIKLNRTLEKISKFTDYCSLDFDILNNGDIGEKIGLELFLNDAIEESQAFKDFIDYLVIGNLCTADKREGVMQLSYRE
jgi:hypothetical protein